METLFPPTTAEEVARMSLERCVRLMPHELDSSGFFVEFDATDAVQSVHVNPTAPLCADAIPLPFPSP